MSLKISTDKCFLKQAYDTVDKAINPHQDQNRQRTARGVSIKAPYIFFFTDADDTRTDTFKQGKKIYLSWQTDMLFRYYNILFLVNECQIGTDRHTHTYLHATFDFTLDLSLFRPPANRNTIWNNYKSNDSRFWQIPITCNQHRNSGWVWENIRLFVAYFWKTKFG